MRHLLKLKTKNITSDLAYVLGVIEGDANIYKNEIRLVVKDKDFALAFKKSLEKWSGMKVYYKENVKRKGYNTNYYQIQLRSVEAASFLKSINLNRILHSNNNVIGSFIRGFADSEGGCYEWLITLYNTDLYLLKFVNKLLKKIGIKSKIRIMKKAGNTHIFSHIAKTKTAYQINICGKDNLMLFSKFIKFNIGRKQTKLDTMYMTDKQRSFMNSLYHNKKNWRMLYCNK
jgi:intein-encoded DNA endonuclease-like protein